MTMLTGSPSPFTTAQAINLAGNTAIFDGCRAIVVTVAGVVKVDTVNSTGVLIPCAAGIPMPIKAINIYSTGNGTTATGVVALS